MLSIEEYIVRRKKEDKLNEFDLDARTQNMKLCVDYVFEYFNNYLNITEAEKKQYYIVKSWRNIVSSLESMSLKLENGLLAFIVSMGSKHTDTLETL